MARTKITHRRSPSKKERARWPVNNIQHRRYRPPRTAVRETTVLMDMALRKIRGQGVGNSTTPQTPGWAATAPLIEICRNDEFYELYRRGWWDCEKAMMERTTRSASERLRPDEVRPDHDKQERQGGRRRGPNARWRGQQAWVGRQRPAHNVKDKSGKFRRSSQKASRVDETTPDPCPPQWKRRPSTPIVFYPQVVPTQTFRDVKTPPMIPMGQHALMVQHEVPIMPLDEMIQELEEFLVSMIPPGVAQPTTEVSSLHQAEPMEEDDLINLTY